MNCSFCGCRGAKAYFQGKITCSRCFKGRVYKNKLKNYNERRKKNEK